MKTAILVDNSIEGKNNRSTNYTRFLKDVTINDGGKHLPRLSAKKLQC